MQFKIQQANITLQCDVIEMGRDLTVAVYGGEVPHIGSVVLAIPRDSLTGKGRSTTCSVLNCIGHKDELLAKQFAEQLDRKSVV